MTNINERFDGFVKGVVARTRRETTAALSPTDRSSLIEMLEQCISHKLLLKRYLRLLQTALNGSTRHNGSITINHGKQLADEGLGILDDSELICLALDPVSMWTLHDLIDEEFPDRWIERVIEADKVWEAIETEGHESSETCEDFPWDEMDLVSGEVVTRVLGNGDGRTADRMQPQANSENVAQPPVIPTTDSRTSYRDRARNAQDTTALPTARLAARQARPVGDIPETTKRQLRFLRKFICGGQQYELFADSNAKVFVAPPANATHLEVGQHDRFHLRDCEHAGMRLVEGITQAPMKRRIAAGESVGFVTNIGGDR